MCKLLTLANVHTLVTMHSLLPIEFLKLMLGIGRAWKRDYTVVTVVEDLFCSGHRQGSLCVPWL